MKPKSVFLCHASEDKPIARKLHSSLIENGIDVWFDEESLLPGQTWEYEIRKAIKSTDYLIILLSKTSVNKTGYVNKEIRMALEQYKQYAEGGLFILPVKAEGCTVHFSDLEAIQSVNLFPDYDKGLNKILKVINS